MSIFSSIRKRVQPAKTRRQSIQTGQITSSRFGKIRETIKEGKSADPVRVVPKYGARARRATIEKYGLEGAKKMFEGEATLYRAIKSREKQAEPMPPKKVKKILQDWMEDKLSMDDTHFRHFASGLIKGINSVKMQDAFRTEIVKTTNKLITEALTNNPQDGKPTTINAQNRKSAISSSFYDSLLSTIDHMEKYLTEFGNPSDKP